MLTGLVRFEGKTDGSVSFSFPSPEEITVQVTNASPREAVWVKMSYYPGWTAYLGDQTLNIFSAGPNMMLCFPERGGDYTVRLVFGRTLEIRVGEIISIVSAVTVCLLASYDFLRVRARKKRMTLQESILERRRL
jgi:hypothetical protein